MNVTEFLDALTAWAENRRDVVGVALVGSHARGTASPDSDVDLVILSEAPADLYGGKGTEGRRTSAPGCLVREEDALWASSSWPAHFGEILSSSLEDYGASKSRRIFYRDGLEVEFGIAEPNWASVPLDAGTKKVLTDGVKVLYDPRHLFRTANDAGAA